jgi:hypothetical protein
MVEAFFSPLCCSIFRHSINSYGDVKRLSLSAVCFIVQGLTENVVLEADRLEIFGCVSPVVRLEN